MKELLNMSATQIAKKIKNREIKSIEATEIFIGQIEKVNPSLNAMVATRFNKAIDEAKQADKKVENSINEKNTSANILPEFHGVPCSIKEAFALEGMPNCSGLVSRKNHRATEDATAVKRYRKAGFIPLGVTNTSELCMWMESNNKVYGRSNNPYNQAHTTGGSSGGEAAIVSAKGVPIGLGSDIGGSIRMPAHFNGIFGLKPTGGRVPGTGQYPMAENKARRYLTTGPLVRFAEDIYPIYKLLSGPDKIDTGVYEMPMGDPSKIKLSELEVIQIPDNGFLSVSNDMSKALCKAIDGLSTVVKNVSTKRMSGLKQSVEIWSSMMSDSGGASFSELLGEGKEINEGLELLKYIFGQSDFTFPALGLAIAEKIPKLVKNIPFLNQDTSVFVKKGLQLKQEMSNLLQDNKVILYPSYTSVAPKHNETFFPPIQWVYTGIWNVLELPVMQVPMGLNKDGLPLGVQIIANHGNEHLAIAVALELEKQFGGWVDPLKK